MRAMAAADDVADLLGNRELPVLHRPPPNSGFSWLQSILILFISLGVVTTLVWCFTDNRSYYMRWREEKYRKRVRRKYGIPDSDHDVFNVAYANAKRREEEALGMRRAQTVLNSPKVGAVPSSTGLRMRGVPGPLDANAVVFPAGTSGQTDRRDHLRTEHAPTSPVKPRAAAVLRAKPQMVEVEDDVDRSAPKSSPEKKTAVGEHKRSRVESEDEGELMNVDPDVLGDISQPKSKRGSKRHAGTDEDATPETSRKKAGKRPRRISRRTQDLLLDLEEQEHGDKLMELDDALSRGKKRDRAEAGSTFGGDDDSPTTRGRKTRRKRRSTANAEAATEAALRGTKRVLDVESTIDSDEDDRVSRTKSVRKRGKHLLADGDSSTDMSLDGPVVTIEPACAGHKIGDEWVVNGQLFKVGPDGKRLRQVLVKKRRSRYSMPTDSQHPDSQAQMVVLIETWLNDEQFEAAEERGDVFSTKKPDEEAEVVAPVKTGKTLLWTPTRNNISPKKAFKDSIIANVGISSNPFDRPSYSSYGRRVSTGHDAFKQGGQSPSLTPSKSYSKWEKQDLEAEAMAKLRKKLEEQKKTTLTASESKKRVTFDLPSSVSAPAMATSITAPAGLGTSASESNSTTKDAAAKPLGNFFGDPSKTAQSMTPSATAPSLSTPGSTSGLFTPAINNKPASTPADSSSSKPPVPLFFAPSAGKEKSQEGGQGTPSVPISSMPVSAPAEPSKPAAPLFSFAPPSNLTSSSSTSNPIAFSEKKGDDTRSTSTPTSAGLFAPKASLPSTIASPIFSIKGAAQSDSSQANPSSSAPGGPFTSSTPASSTTPGGFNLGAKLPPPTATPSSAGFSFFNQAKPQTPVTDAAKAVSTTPAGTPSVPNSSTTPKFSFGFSTPAATTTPSEPAKTAAPSFASNSTSTMPKIAFPSTSFGGSAATAPPASKSGFSFTPALNTTMPSTTPSAPSTGIASSSTTTPTFSFNVGGAGNGTANPSGPSPSSGVFGGAPKPSTGSSPFFSNANSKTADVPKPLFGFGSGGSALTPTTPGATSATEKSDKPAFSFNFSGAPSSATPNGNANGTQPASNPFDNVKPAGTSGFTFGVPSNGSTTTNVFGKPSNGAAATTNIFGGGSGGSVFGNSQQKSS